MAFAEEIVKPKVCNECVHQKPGENNPLRPHEAKPFGCSPQKLVHQLKERRNNLKEITLPRLPNNDLVNEKDQVQETNRPKNIVENLCVEGPVLLLQLFVFQSQC